MKKYALKKREVQIVLSEQCNLNCIYCYEHSKGLTAIDFSLAKTIIEHEFSLAEQDNITMLNIYFHGGEICLFFDLLKKVCEWIWSKEWNVCYHCSATTNGTLVHGEIQNWFKNNADRFTLGLSLDGNRHQHNLNRCNSYDDIDLDFFVRTYPNQQVKMTISPLTVYGLSDGVLDVMAKGFKLSANLAFDCDWGDESLKYQYAKELFYLSNYFLSNPEVVPPLKLFDKNLISLGLQLYLKEEIKPQRSCGSGVNMCCYDTNGTKYPCQMFVPSSTGERIIDSWKIADQDLDYSLECTNCAIYAICPNCIGSLYAMNEDFIREPDNMCDFKKIEILNYTYFLSQVINANKKYKYHTYNSLFDSLNMIAIAFLQRRLRESSIYKYVEKLNV